MRPVLDRAKSILEDLNMRECTWDIVSMYYIKPPENVREYYYYFEKIILC